VRTTHITVRRGTQQKEGERVQKEEQERGPDMIAKSQRRHTKQRDRAEQQKGRANTKAISILI